jgi:hypothetical protein
MPISAGGRVVMADLLKLEPRLAQPARKCNRLASLSRRCTGRRVRSGEEFHDCPPITEIRFPEQPI